MYPLNYVFCPPKHRISGVSDYLAIRRNSPDPHPWKALGSGDGLRATHHRLHQRGEGEGHCRGFGGFPLANHVHGWGQLLFGVQGPASNHIASVSLNQDYSLTRRNSIVTAFALSMHSHCITSGFPQGKPPPFSSRMIKGKMS